MGVGLGVMETPIPRNESTAKVRRRSSKHEEFDGRSVRGRRSTRGIPRTERGKATPIGVALGVAGCR